MTLLDVDLAICVSAVTANLPSLWSAQHQGRLRYVCGVMLLWIISEPDPSSTSGRPPTRPPGASLGLLRSNGVFRLWVPSLVGAEEGQDDVMTERIRIAAAQLPVSHDPAANGEAVRHLMLRARKDGARLVQFPEGAICGYAAAPMAADQEAVRRQLRLTTSLAGEAGPVGDYRCRPLPDPAALAAQHPLRDLPTAGSWPGATTSGCARTQSSPGGIRLGSSLWCSRSTGSGSAARSESRSTSRRSSSTPRAQRRLHLVLLLLRRPGLRNPCPRACCRAQLLGQHLGPGPVQHCHASSSHRPARIPAGPLTVRPR